MVHAHEYKTLARLFHADRSTDAYHHLDEVAKQRLEAESTYRTHIHTSLGELFVAMPRELSTALNNVLLTERHVSQLWDTLPRPIQRTIIVHLVTDEILASNEIEGVRSTRKEVADAISAAHNHTDTRFSEFAKLYLTLSDQQANKLHTLQDIREIYDKIAFNEIDQSDYPDGELFRAREVSIVDGSGITVHSGARNETAITAFLTQMIGLLHNDSIPHIIAAIVAHFIFEYAHPFYDGNGRTGRYLLALSLHDYFTMPTVLSLSQVIAENKNKYYKAFTIAEEPLNRGELTSFVIAMLDFIEQAQRTLISDLEQRAAQIRHLENVELEISQANHLTTRASKLLSRLIQEIVVNPEATISLEEAAEELQVSKQSARKYVAELADHGLVEFASRKPLRVGLPTDMGSQMSVETHT